MIQIIKEINVEVTKPNIFQALVAKQYDMNTRFLKVTLMDCGKRIDVPYVDTAKVVINAERKDGQSKGFEGAINEDGTVTVPLHSWMLELDGTVICDISVIDTATDDNKKLTTTSFTLMVEKAAFGGEDITNDPQFDVLVALMDAATVAQEALDKSNEANSKYDACVEATENANKAADEANAVREEVEAGGYIKSLQEENNGNKFSVWVGTEEEYAAIPEANRIPNCLYIPTNDKTFEDILKQITNIAIESETAPGCFYRMVDGEKEWLNPPMEHGVEYRTTERWNYQPVYVMSDTFSVNESVINIPIPVEELVSFSGHGFYISENQCNDIIPFYISDSNYVGFMVEDSQPSISFSDGYVSEDGDYNIEFIVKYTKPKAGE